ncbi:MAG: nitroreductase family deazaflavin-dependent oxidoreductase [Nocardioides sp.]
MPDTKARPQGLDSAFARALIKYGGRVQVRVYRLTGGRVGGRWRIGAGLRRPVPTLLLDHVGRTSGRRYTIPLLYLLDGPNVVVVASSGGMRRHPQWYRNLQAHRDTRVQIRSEVREVRARTATPDEKAVLWPRLVELYADFERYQSWTEREIPVVVLEPR